MEESGVAAPPSGTARPDEGASRPTAAEVADAVVRSFTARLRAAGSMPLDREELLQNVRGQVGAIVLDVLDVLDTVDEYDPSPVAVPSPSGSDGTDTVPSPPATSWERLSAATTLFDVALPVLITARSRIIADGLDAHDAARIAQLLHRSITRRVVFPAVGPLDVLLERVVHAHHEERRRTARELHDRVAHGIGAGLQGIELSELYAQDRALAASRLRRARDVLAETLKAVRSMAAGLREPVSDRCLGAALAEYLLLTAPPELRTEVVVGDDVDRIPAHVKEEVFVIAREAMRNSLLHAEDATHLAVHIATEQSHVSLEITDDGVGFDPTAVPARSLGLRSIRERVDLLDGTLDVDSLPGRGTSVRMRAPLPLP